MKGVFVFSIMILLLVFGCVDVIGDEPNEFGFCYEEGTAVCFDDSNQDWAWICEVEGAGKYCNKGIKAGGV